jgi:hypothetical protein
MDKKLERQIIWHALTAPYMPLIDPKTNVINTGRRKEKDLLKIQKAEQKRLRKAERNKK